MNANPTPIDRWVVNPLTRFMGNSSASGFVLFGSAVLSLIIANSFFAPTFDAILDRQLGFTFGRFQVYKPLLLWINDGLMSMFFFVIGLELKREIIAGELSRPKDAVLPIVAGLGGMAVPAVIYILFTSGTGTDAVNGWGIPMATDIAFALGVLYLLGPRVPVSLKIFLTAVAIIDDIGAVSVIAFFYTSDISVVSLVVGGIFLAIMAVGNVIGIRSTLFYATFGIGGLWLAFLLSGVHATIAAVLAALTIPGNVKLSRGAYSDKVSGLLQVFSKNKGSSEAMASKEEQYALDEIKAATDHVISPLQKLEHSMHPMVAFLVMPIFALANAGISFSGDMLGMITSPVSLGVIFGLLLGKVLGIVSFVFIAEKLRLITLPPALTYKALLGLAFLAAIGFTMSLFISSLAFYTTDYEYQARIGILIASFIAGLLGYQLLKSSFPAPAAK